MPILSVIVPVYNTEKYLHRCVDSLLQQDLKDIEIILVNDGSTDGSGAICDDYARIDGRVKVIKQDNGGLSAARNTGIAVANGKYIVFVDSDDWVDHDIFASDAALMETEQDIDICVSSDNKIIVMMMGVMCANQIFFSYYANVLARRYDAEIVAGLAKAASAAPFEKAVYKSFGVHEYLDKPLSYSQRKRVDEIFTREYPKLKSSDDWLAFTLDGINYGYEIYRNYLRNISAIYDRARYGKELARILKRAIEIHIRYGDYFNTHSVKAIILTDALYDEGILRLLAWKRGIAVYAADDGRIFRWYPNIPHVERYGHNYKKMFAALPENLQKKGIAWAKEHLDKRLQGDISDIPYIKGKGAFNKIKSTNVLKKSHKIKVVICPHALTDDPYQGGKFLFNDHWSWLCYLGDMSERTDYDWYLKEHPAADKYSYDIWDKFLKKYPKIIKLPLDTSPVQLKNEGMDFALTICGTIGHEYPALGIQVINAGPNPHDDFDFDWNPKTVEEYERLLLHLPQLKKKIDLNEIYQFYCMYFLYDLTDRRRPHDIFFDNNLYGADSQWPTEIYQNKYGLMAGSKVSYYDKAYRWFMDEFSVEKHQNIIDTIEKTINEIDNEGPENKKIYK